MASVINDEAPSYRPSAVETLSPEDFETASIRSAAPSYTSEAPSYHSTVIPNEPLPPYSPPGEAPPMHTILDSNVPARLRSGSQNSSSNSSSTPRSTPSMSVTSLLDIDAPPRRSSAPTTPPTTNSSASTSQAPRRSSTNSMPSLDHFRIPSWSPASATRSNPNARIYHNVALRRAAAAAAATNNRNSSSVDNLSDRLRRAMVLSRIAEEESGSEGHARGSGEGQRAFRPQEDPWLVGEEAAERARRERLERERYLGEEVLLREDRKWDWFLAQIREREEQEKVWRRLRQEMGRRPNNRFAFLIGSRF